MNRQHARLALVTAVAAPAFVPAFVSVFVSTFVSACAPPLAGLEGGTATIGYFSRRNVLDIDTESRLAVTFTPADDGDRCPIFDELTRATLDGDEIGAGFQRGALVDSIAPFVFDSCSPPRIDTAVPRDANARDASLTIEDPSGARLSWTGANLVADRRLVPLDPIVDVRVGDTLRFRYEPASDAPTSASFTSVAPGDDGSTPAFERVVDVDADGTFTFVFDPPFVVDVFSLDVSMPITLGTVACEGFAACDVVDATHDERIDIEMLVE